MVAGLCMPVYLYMIMSLGFVFNLLLKGNNFIATFALFVTILRSVRLLMFCNKGLYASAWSIVIVIFGIVIYLLQ